MSNTNMPEAVEENLTSTEKQQSSEDNNISKIRSKLSTRLDNIEKDISKIEKSKQNSIEIIENKKMELRNLLNPEEISKEHIDALKELEMTEIDIQARKFSITKLDETIANFDLEIARIQAEHEKAVAELKEKWKKLNEQLEYYEKLNEKIAELAKMIKEQGEKYDDTLKALRAKRSELLKRTDLSETTLNKMLREIDDQMESLQRDHDTVIHAANETLLDYTTDQAYEGDTHLTEDQMNEIETFEKSLEERKGTRLSKQQRLSLLQRNMQITPSGRIITQDDKVLTVEAVRHLGYLSSLDDFDNEEEQAEVVERRTKQQSGAEDYEGQGEQALILQEKEIIIATISSSSRTPSVSGSSISSVSGLSGQDTEYLKQTFGKSLSLALAEITAVQPTDPIHYLAHWLFKYRYNQEIDCVKKLEVQALIEERQRLVAEKWHLELEQEARLAVQEAIFRAVNIVLQQDYAMSLLADELQSEYEEGETVTMPSQLGINE